MEDGERVTEVTEWQLGDSRILLASFVLSYDLAFVILKTGGE